MELNTASAVLGFAKKLEEDATKVYAQFAERHPEKKDLFLAFAEEGRKNKVLLSRVYQEIITDAFEACFSVKGMNPNDYETKIEIEKTADLAEVLSIAIEMEEKAVKFYANSAEQFKPLLTDISRAFEKIAKMRKDRGLKLESLG